MKLTCSICLVVLFQLLFSVSSLGQNESFYITILQKCLGGEAEKTIVGGRIDLVTDEYAIEVEFAPKWKQAIGQSLWYGFQTNKKAGIILIVQKPADYNYNIRLNSTLEYAQLSDNIKVWLYPMDFAKCALLEQEAKTEVENRLKLLSEESNEKCCWLTVSSKKRHNKSCKSFHNTKGRYCDKSEGIACKICGG